MDVRFEPVTVPPPIIPRDVEKDENELLRKVVAEINEEVKDCEEI